ncbi:ABC transporter substrate-binding protein [Roseomonas sp. OT10]|uniref:ABC transporter substrate-binding protein n=1 Tax=Roseomonas cutis TaxID=2897332 RepID=UPI001E2D5C02|nr:ABC transporter substrate-binding protein [Roseomonas sp. OT10]UFN49533.1 ABC transporter substrate-binding protein [Roseomonas sp. OT10]
MAAPLLSRRAALGALAIGVMGSTRAARGQVLDKVTLQTAWRAQAEHGGYYQGVAEGIYRKAGIDMEVRMGGPQIDSNALLFAGRVDIATGSGMIGLRYVQEKLPFVVIATTFQKDTRVLLSHPGVGNDTLPALKGKPILVAASSRAGYWPWLVKRFGFEDEQIRPYTFNIGPFLQNKQLSMQGLATSEPMDARRQGIDPVVHLLADYGWADYSQTLNTSQKLLAEKPDLLQRVVKATAEGWQSYLHGDPAPGNRLIQKDNPDMDAEKIAFAIKTMNESGLIESGDAGKLGIGAMTDARWEAFYTSMVEAGVLPAGLDYRQAYTLRFFGGA